MCELRDGDRSPVSASRSSLGLTWYGPALVVSPPEKRVASLRKCPWRTFGWLMMPAPLVSVMAGAGEGPEVVLEATYC